MQTDLDAEPGGDGGPRRLGVHDQSAGVNTHGLIGTLREEDLGDPGHLPPGK